MPPNAICQRRKRLYQQQLDNTRAAFRKTVKALPPDAAARVGPALTDEALIDALEELLNVYVTYGVQRDMRRLEPSQVLFLTDPEKRPALDDVLPSGRSKPIYDGSAAVVDDRKDVANQRRGYDRYFEWYIDPKKIKGRGPKPPSGVEAFYERYPLLRHALHLVTAHHRTNVELACRRVNAGWDKIEAAFFAPRKMTKLAGIKTTGSDFHKGGKQVLILAFSLDDGSTGRLVYKPSSVEVDCRIVGDSAFVNRLAPQGYSQSESLIERVNKHVGRLNPSAKRPEGFTAQPLPTYRILPFNRGSVPNAYGYIEFLTREPEFPMHGVGEFQIPAAIEEKIAELHADDVKASDWITTDPQDGMAFYHQLGALMAIATAFSFTDVHVQNAIAHRRLPHLIDLEEAFKQPMAGVDDTKMSLWLNEYSAPGGKRLDVKQDQTSSLYTLFPVSVEPAPCALYLVNDSGTAEQVTTTAPKRSDSERKKRARANRKAMSAGFSEVVEALADADCNKDVQAWAGELSLTVARYVTRATVDYAENCRSLYADYCEQPLPEPIPDGWYAAVSFTAPGMTAPSFFFLKMVASMRSLWATRLASSASQPPLWPSPPFFAAEHPEHAWHDYLNCDVPSFYHVLGSPHILNARGGTVNVKDAVEWQDSAFEDAAGPLPQGWQARSDGSYLPQTPIAMIGDQLTRLQSSCATAQGMDAYIGQILKGAGLQSDFRPLAKHVQSTAGSVTPTPATGSGS